MLSIAIIVLGIAVLSLGGCDVLAGIFGWPTTAAWDTDAQSHRGQYSQTFKYTLPAGGTEDSVWGTDVYTDDSSIGTAAVHAGIITFAAGGTVTIRILADPGSYTGTTRNGVTSLDYGSWDSAFEFVAP
jgi:hypothetical protein